MYLSQVLIENFRIFGPGADGQHLDLVLRPGLNVVVGENDSGKTALIDAIRLVLGTRDYEWLRLGADDFHVGANGCARDLRIECRFEGLDDEEASVFLEWLGVGPNGEGGSTARWSLRVWLEAHRKDVAEVTSRFDREISVSVRAGPGDEGARMDVEARELLRATYLKPLRDAEQELAGRRGSRLSQVLLAHPEIRQQDKEGPDTLVSIMRDANTSVKRHPAIEGRVASLNRDYLSQFSLGDEPLYAAIDISAPDLRGILERLELSLADEVMSGDTTRHGLGVNNLLFMATELLLLQSPNAPLPLVLIEEPEAHLHPQLQLRLIEFLKKHAPAGIERPIQVIMTSHSPNLASTVDLEHLIIMKNGRAYPMGPTHTRLSPSDYGFLRRFLDVTKASLFFAQGVLIVEGYAEQILLPVVAELLGRPLARYGVSIITVGHSGLFRYAHVFQRGDDEHIGVRVACVTDLDIPPDAAKDYLRRDKQGNPRRTMSDYSDDEEREVRERKTARPGGEPTRTYVSPHWTLEYDMAAAGWGLRVHAAVQLAAASARRSEGLDEARQRDVIRRAITEYRGWKRDGKTNHEVAALIYRPLYDGTASKAEAAQYLAELLMRMTRGGRNAGARCRSRFPSYLVRAIDYVTRNDTADAGSA